MYRCRRIMAFCAAVFLSLACVTSFSLFASADDNASMGWYVSLSFQVGSSWNGPYLVPFIEGCPNIVTSSYTDRNTWRINGVSHNFGEDRLTRGTFYLGIGMVPVAYNSEGARAIWNVNSVNESWGNNLRFRVFKDTNLPNTNVPNYYVSNDARYFLVQFSLIPDAIDPYFGSTGTFTFDQPLVVQCLNAAGSQVSSKLFFYNVDVVYYPNFYEMVSAGLDNSNIAQRLVYYVMQIAQKSYDAQLDEMATLIHQMEADTLAISSDVENISDLETEHNEFQHEIQDQMEGAWNSYSSGASDGSDALEELDASSIGDYNPNVVEPALESGLLDWFTTNCHDSLRPFRRRDEPETAVVDFMSDWYSEFYGLLGGDSDG